MGLSLEQRFGTGASLSGGVLSVNITNLTGLTSATATPDQIFAAMILHNKAIQPTNALDDATVGVTIDDPFLQIVRSDSQIQYSYNVGLYKAAALGGSLDPDDVVS